MRKARCAACLPKVIEHATGSRCACSELLDAKTLQRVCLKVLQQQLAGRLVIEDPIFTLCDRRLVRKRDVKWCELCFAHILSCDKQLFNAERIEMPGQLRLRNFAGDEFAGRHIGIRDANNARLNNDGTHKGITIDVEQLLTGCNAGSRSEERRVGKE